MIPAVTPIPAIIKPTSPLEVIPNPTLRPPRGFFKARAAGIPQPTNLLIIAIAIKIIVRTIVSKFKTQILNAAPITAKNIVESFLNKLNIVLSYRNI